MIRAMTEFVAESSGTRLRKTIIPFALFLLQAASALASSRPISPGDYKGYNVLLVTLDTTRADRLPMYGYSGVETPSLTRFAADAFVFEDAISHIPLTLPSHTSIMTGLLPPQHGVRDNSGYFLDEKFKTLAEYFHEKGYQTSAFVSSFVLESRWKLNQGFDFYYDYFNLAEYRDINPRDIQRRGEETEAEAAQWLISHKAKPFFCWVHFYDPHDPYDPPEPYKTRYSDRLYDGEIAYMDHVFGLLMKQLEDLGIKQKTLIVVTGDHGENLGEHNEKTHAIFIYDSTQHVPLMISLPGRSGHRCGPLVQHIDIAPTLLELYGMKPSSEMQGTSLIGLMNGSPEKEEAVYSESLYSELHYGWSGLRSITTANFKYIDAPKPELYDRIKDPGETVNLISEMPDVVRSLKQKLFQYPGGVSEPQKMDPETEEKLRALGYIGNTATKTSTSVLIDPKDKIQLVRSISVAFGAIKERDYPTAVRELKEVTKEDPEMVDGHVLAGISYMGLEDYNEAIDELLKGVSLRPDYTMALFNLANAYQLAGNYPEAERWYLKVLDYEKNHTMTTLRLAHLYREMGRQEDSQKFFKAALKTYEDSLLLTKSDSGKSGLYATLGEIYFGSADYEASRKNLAAALALTPERPTLHYNLAQVYEAEQKPDQAIDEYQKETLVDPSSFKAFNNLGLLYRLETRYAEAVPCFQKVIELNPQDPRGYLLLASTYHKMGDIEAADRVVKIAIERKIDLSRDRLKQ